MKMRTSITAAMRLANGDHKIDVICLVLHKVDPHSLIEHIARVGRCAVRKIVGVEQVATRHLHAASGLVPIPTCGDAIARAKSGGAAPDPSRTGDHGMIRWNANDGTGSHIRGEPFSILKLVAEFCA